MLSSLLQLYIVYKCDGEKGSGGKVLPQSGGTCPGHGVSGETERAIDRLGVSIRMAMDRLRKKA